MMFYDRLSACNRTRGPHVCTGKGIYFKTYFVFYRCVYFNDLKSKLSMLLYLSLLASFFLLFFSSVGTLNT